jgi:hypothetical protein
LILFSIFVLYNNIFFYFYFILHIYINNELENYFIVGGKIKASVFKQVLQNGYQKKPHDDIEGYKLDKELSGQRAQVYYNKDTNHTVVNHRGTSGIHDMYTDVKLMLGIKNNERFKHSKKVTDEAIKKYNDSNITITGHSLDHAIAKESNKPHQKELVTLNGAVTPHDLLTKQRDNEYVIRTEYDPVSALHTLNPLSNNKNTTTIKSDSLNLLNEHKTDVLDRLDPELKLGRSIKSNQLNSMDKVREFMKKYKL